MTPTSVHHCRMEINHLLRNWIFCIISNCRQFDGNRFLSFFNLRKFRMRNHLLKCNVCLLTSNRFRRLFLYFFLFLSGFFCIFFGSFFCLFSFFLFSFSFFFFLFLIPLKLCLCNKLCNCHWIIPVNKFLIVLLIYLNSLTSKRQVFKLHSFLRFEWDWNGFTCFGIEESRTWLKLKVLMRSPVKFYGSYRIIPKRKCESFYLIDWAVIKIYFIFFFIW